ncbi:MAG: OmpA family protein [Bacteroidota bacterium]
MKKITLLLLIVVPLILQAQDTKLQKAETAWDKKDYYDAAILYKGVLKSEGNKRKTQKFSFIIGECYRFANNIKDARAWYEKSIKAGNTDADVTSRYAEMSLMSGKYEDALNYYKKYNALVPEDSMKTMMKIESCNFALSWKGYKSPFKVKAEKKLNSKFSEYGLAMVSGDLYFASSRLEKNATRYYSYTGQGFSDFFVSKWDVKGNRWKKPEKAEGGINSNFNDGCMAYDPTRKIVFYTQCNGSDGKDDLCQIWYSKFDDSSKMWEPANLFEITGKDYSIGHPTLTSNGNVMFFISNMPQGLGGTDIYMVERIDDNTWSIPKNLGPTINTTGNEMFPFVSNDTAIYYSTDGKVGMGGLDMFWSKINNYEFSEPINLGPPFNSSSDDFGILVLTSDSGMFCSSRSGESGDDDIYSYKTFPFTIKLSGTVVDKDTRKPIEKSIVILKGDNGQIDSTLSDLKGFYSFSSLKAEVTYNIVSSKFGYLNDSKILSTVGVKTNRNFNEAVGFVVNFELQKITHDEIELKDIYYDFDKWDLRDTSKVQLDTLVLLMSENPDICIIINSHTDERGDSDYNIELSKNRAQSVVNYLIEQKVDTKRLGAKGWGFINPRVKNAKTEEEHQMNRRTTFNIVNATELTSDTLAVRFKNIENNISVNNQKKVEKDFLTEFEFTVQIHASKKDIDPKLKSDLENSFPGQPISNIKERDGTFKYFIGSFTNYDEAAQLENELKKMGYKPVMQCYMGGEKFDVAKARKMLEN